MLQDFDKFMTRGSARLDDDAGFCNLEMFGEDFNEGGIRGAVDWLFAEIDGEIFGNMRGTTIGGSFDDEWTFFRAGLDSYGIDHLNFLLTFE